MAYGTSDERRARAKAMHDLYMTGLSIKEVGQRNGITKQAVSQTFQRYQMPIRNSEKQMLIDTAAIYKRYEAGEKLADMAAENGISQDYMYRLLNKDGFRLRSSGRPHKWSAERVAELYAHYMEGKTQTEIAEDCNLSQSFISALFRKHGFATNPPGKKPGCNLHLNDNDMSADEHEHLPWLKIPFD